MPFYPFLGETTSRSPSSVLQPFVAEGSPTKIDYRKKGNLILTFLLEDLDLAKEHSISLMMSANLGPPVVPFYLFFGETKIDYTEKKKNTLILNFLLEDLDLAKEHSISLMMSANLGPPVVPFYFFLGRLK